MIKHVGFPKCVSNEPFKLVHSPAELQAWRAEHPEEAKAMDQMKKQSTKKAS